MARKFFSVSAAILMLSIAYNLGARNATAQGTNIVASIGLESGAMMVVTQAGDCYKVGSYAGGPYPGTLVGNVFYGATAVTPTTLGRLKATYR